ncbi:hypothetical protein CHS0354_039804 [Potamilus streckersoni]|uniref:Uncharacterized protein n=1 Tax=Potamilus streckersoni TaxID=2493646 RepID=A0AAE0W067_9BIVA|nr:hypothetical protein CHS0354_039804 [Potamilus streckersoni]
MFALILLLCVTVSKAFQCTMEVQQFSSIYLEHWIGLLQPHFAHYNLVFENTTVITELSTAIRPRNWVWTYHPPNSVNPYLNWPVDFPILSFGLLCAKCLNRDVLIHMNVTPPNCTIALGYQNASLAIASAFNKMTQNYLVQFHQSYNYSYWCYLTEIPGVRDTFAYQFALYFNFPLDFLRYKCCNSSFNYYNDTVDVSCPAMMIEKWRESTLGPYIIGLVLLCYCPLILCSWVNTMQATGRKIPAESQYEDLDDSDKRQWIYLDGHAPISLTNLLCGLCDLGWKHPVAVSRLRRVLFMLFSPILIYLQFLLYSTYQFDITLDLIDHGVPMGFLSMLGGNEKSKRLFVPMLGGPYCLLYMYYLTGFIFLIIPRNLGDILQRGSFDSKYTGMSPLILSTDRIEEISMVSVNQYRGYKRLSMLILARFYLIMMPRFWVEAVHIVWCRLKCHLDLLMLHLPKPIFIIFASILVPFHLLIGSLEICFSLIYYCIPIIWFLLVVIKGFVSRTTEFIETHSPMNMPHSCRLVLRITMFIIIAPLLLYFVYGFFAIYLASFSIVGEIIVFLFYALVLFPSSSFGYLFFGGALLYYVWKLLQGIGDVYYELLSDLFEVCSNLELNHNIPTLHNSTVMIKAPPGLKINTLRVNDITINLTEEQTNLMHNSANTKVTTYVHYDKHIPGISRRLFMHVVRNFKPVHITVFQAIFRIGLIVLLVVGTMKLSMNSNGMSSEISEVMHVLFIVVIGALPRVLEITLSHSDKAVHREIHLRMLEIMVQEYDHNII